MKITVCKTLTRHLGSQFSSCKSSDQKRKALKSVRLIFERKSLEIIQLCFQFFDDMKTIQIGKIISLN